KPDGAPLRRPYCYPVLADDNTPVTADQTLTGGDHPHHRSFWVGQGDVNGADHWGTNDATPEGPHQLPRGKPTISGSRLAQTLAWGCGPGCTLVEDRSMAFIAYP